MFVYMVPLAVPKVKRKRAPPGGKIQFGRIRLADASLVHLANREGIEMMFTLDRRDFGVLRLAHGRKLRLIP
jgi:hypothetical protein